MHHAIIQVVNHLPSALQTKQTFYRRKGSQRLPFLMQKSMCLAIPARIENFLDDGMARVRLGNSDTFLTCSLMLLNSKVQQGDYVIVHAGFALEVVPKDQAELTLAAVKEFTDAAAVPPQ